MKFKYLSLIPILFLFSFWIQFDDEDEIISEKSVPTGILLDSIGNEVFLVLVNDLPDHYFAPIFTPVCNTGECLPVKINFYWDLNGTYLKFDQPKEEILTKLDHVPFSEQDYRLLDNILSGSDPRFSGPVKHSQGSSSDNPNQSNPAPTQVRVMGKYEMVDGITGSTLPQSVDKFVPGALYTTYTLWGLAHDNQYQMQNYTNFSLIKRQTFQHFIVIENGRYADQVVARLCGNSPDPNIHAKVCLGLLDSGSVEVQKRILQKFTWNEYQLPEVCDGLHNKFYNSDDESVRTQILARWTYNYICESSMKMLAVNLHTNEDLFAEIMMVYDNKTSWPEDVGDNLINEIPKLKPANQEKLKSFLKGKKDLLTSTQLKKLKRM